MISEIIDTARRITYIEKISIEAAIQIVLINELKEIKEVLKNGRNQC